MLSLCALISDQYAPKVRAVDIRKAQVEDAGALGSGNSWTTRAELFDIVRVQKFRTSLSTKDCNMDQVTSDSHLGPRRDEGTNLKWLPPV